MAEDISNKTLAVLVAVAIVVSVTGLFIGGRHITGLQTAENASGTVQANVEAGVNIELDDATIDFGNMFNDQTNNSEGIADNFTLINTGTTVVDIDYWADEELFLKDCAGADTANDNASNACYQIRVMEDGGATTQGSYATYQNIVIAFGSKDPILVNLDTGDNATFGVQVDVPHYEDSGSKSSTLNFEGYEHV